MNTTIKETTKAAFALAGDAKRLRDSLAKVLPTIVGRDHAVAHRAYVVLNDFAHGFDALEAKIAESHVIGRYF